MDDYILKPVMKEDCRIVKLAKAHPRCKQRGIDIKLTSWMRLCLNVLQNFAAVFPWRPEHDGRTVSIYALRYDLYYEDKVESTK